MTPRILPALGALLALGLAAPAAQATASCSFGTVVGVSFGSYDVFGASPNDSAGSISFSCLGVGASDTIVVDLSIGGGSSYLPRSMTSGAGVLAYNLFIDAARMAIWGDGIGATGHYGPVTPVSGVTVTIPVYGRVPAQQNVPVGSYGDTIVVTILY